MHYHRKPFVGFFSVILLLPHQADSVVYVDPILNQQDGQIQKAVLFALIPVVVAFSFIVFIFYRSKREAHFRQKEAEMQLSISEMEMRALRAQINPHFIFNCLNSIHHYMHGHDVSKASEYLIKFSQLIRHVLEMSSFKMISVGDDVNALKLYLELEQLRTNYSFDFEIVVSNDIDLDAVEIPPLFIQPFVENSIWHGLNSLGHKGRIFIDITKKDGMLVCTIEDNGRDGGAKADLDLSHAVKKTSMGTALIQDRLNVVNQGHKTKAGFVLNDLTNSDNEIVGKRVTLVLPYEE